MHAALYLSWMHIFSGLFLAMQRFFSLSAYFINNLKVTNANNLKYFAITVFEGWKGSLGYKQRSLNNGYK